MSVILNVYGTNTTSTTLPTACTMVTGTGGTVTSRTTTIGTKSGFGQLWSQPGGVWPATTQSTIGDPDGHGWLYDTMDLESASIVSGVWTAKLQLAASVNTTLVGDLYCRWYVYNTISDTYTLIAQAVQTGNAFSTAQTIYTLTSGAIGRITFGDGDMLYRGVWVNVTTPGTSTGQGLIVRMANSSTAGVANVMETDTPGMQRFRSIPCDAALSIQRLIPATAALQPPTGIRLISCDSALVLTQTSSISCDSALLLTSSRSMTCDSALLQEQPPRTMTCDSALLQEQARTIAATCALGSSARLIPASASLNFTQTHTLPCSVSLAPSPFTRFPTTSRRTGLFPFTGRRTGVFPETKRRES